MKSRPLLPFALLPSVLALAPLPAQEQAAALANESFVETCEPPLQRRLDAGLHALRSGDAKAAVPQLLPALSAESVSPQLRYGPRETRRFHDVLEAELGTLSAEQRAVFTSGFESGAQAALQRAGLDPELLRQLLVQFPGTAASGAARLRLCDRALERGDAVAAAFWLRGLAESTRAPRRELLGRLLSTANGPHARPYGIGRIDGTTAPSGCTPSAEAPIALSRGGQRWLVPGRVGIVTGRGDGGAEFAILQTPIDAVRVDPEGRRVQLLRLAQQSGIEAGLAERPTPSLAGDTLYLVHGTSDPAALEARGLSARNGPASALLAIALADGSLRWQWSPELPAAAPGEDPPEVVLHPHALAIGRRIYVLFSSLADPLRRQVHAACLDAEGQLLWQRFLAQGAPVTRDLLESRQETLGSGRHVPAAPIFANGLLVCSTGLGIVAGLDPLTGEMQWSFRTARIRALGEKSGPWHEGRLAAAGDEIWFAPSDSTWFYRLRSSAGTEERLAATPRARASLTHFVALAPGPGLAAFVRQGLVETAPAQLRLAPPARRGERSDAPPLQPGEHFVSAIADAERLWLASDRTLYELDLTRELYYAQVLDFGRSGLDGVYALAPLAGGLLLASPGGIFVWR